MPRSSVPIRASAPAEARVLRASIRDAKQLRADGRIFNRPQIWVF